MGRRVRAHRRSAARAAARQVEFYTSGRASNEAAYLYQLFARELGTNNFPDCSNMCHEPTSVGLPQSIGIGKGTVSLEDFDHCELIISIGHNPGTNHPRMMGTLHECARRNVPIIVFNPLRERALERFADPQDMIEMASFGSTRIASTYYQVDAGGDAAALKGIMKALLQLEAERGNVLDRDFIAQHTNGFDAFSADLEATSWDDIERASESQPGAARTGRARVREVERDDRHVRDGRHAAQQGDRNRAPDRRPAADARQHRQARRRRVPAARPLERAGQPHGRHHRSRRPSS